MCFVFSGNAQTNNHPNGHNSCISDQMRKNIAAKDPTYLQKEQQFNEKIRQLTAVQNNQSNLRTTTTVIDGSNPCIIPVVFHIVVPPGQTLNTFMPDVETRIDNSIKWLNAAFAAQVPYGGTNSNIKFVLAQQDINQHYTTGITQITNSMSNLIATGATTLISYDDALINAIKAQNGGSSFLFPNDKYVNILVVNNIVSNDGTIPAGYAYFPVNPNRTLANDVIICNKDYIGTTTADNVVFIHEMGHFLGLYHTFEGGLYK